MLTVVKIMNFTTIIQISADFNYVNLWSSPYSWGGADPPEDGDMVVIPSGETIVVDINTAVVKLLLIKGKGPGGLNSLLVPNFFDMIIKLL